MAAQIDHLPARLRELLGARLDRDVYLSTQEAAQLTSQPTRRAFIAWARRNGVRLRKPSPDARKLFVRKGDIDAALAREHR